MQIRVWPAFLSIVKPAHERPNTHKREEIFRSQEGEAPPDIVVAADTDDGEFICGEVGKYFAPILTQLAIFSVRELTIIMARILPRSENSDYFIGSQRHHWPQHGAVNERKNGGVNANTQCKCNHCNGSEARRFAELAKGEFEIIHHRFSFTSHPSRS